MDSRDCKHKFGAHAQFWGPEWQQWSATGRQSCQCRQSPTWVGNTEQSLELFMHLTDFEESTGTNLCPPRPITNMSAWPDPEQAAIAQRAVAHSCPLTEDPRQAFLSPGAQRCSAQWHGDGFTGEHYLTSDWAQTCSQWAAHRAVSLRQPLLHQTPTHWAGCKIHSAWEPCPISSQELKLCRSNLDSKLVWSTFESTK